jgi:hypothetical protein
MKLSVLRRNGRLRTSLRTRLRGHCLEALRLAISAVSRRLLDQGQEPGSTHRKAPRRGRLPQVQTGQSRIGWNSCRFRSLMMRTAFHAPAPHPKGRLSPATHQRGFGFSGIGNLRRRLRTVDVRTIEAGGTSRWWWPAFRNTLLSTT